MRRYELGRARRVWQWITAIVVFLCLADPSWGQESGGQVSVSPPPLAYPDYSEQGTTQSRVTVTSITIESPDISMTGGGASYTGRYVLEPPSEDTSHAFGGSIGVFGFEGTAMGFEMSGGGASLLVNYERELFTAGSTNLIGFIGPALQYGYTSMSADTFFVETNMYLGGGQAGLQFSIQMGPLVLSPFLMAQGMGGTVQTHVIIAVPGGAVENTSSADIGFATRSMGIDLLHTPSGLTLSGMIQATQQDNDDAVDVTIIQLSYAFGAESPVDVNYRNQ